MNQARGILFLADPMNADSAIQKKSQSTNSMTLIFDENGRYLSLAQTALWRIRRRFEWVCVAAEGRAACIGIALAAQLPVDRLVLAGSSLFAPGRARLSRELARLEGYARRNLALVISELLLIGAEAGEVRGFARGRSRGRLCVLEGDAGGWDPALLTASWERLCRNNLLIP